jgi:hypothetical protein
MELMDGTPRSVIRPPRRIMALSKDILVRVDGSKNNVARIFPSKALELISPRA